MDRAAYEASLAAAQSHLDRAHAATERMRAATKAAVEAYERARGLTEQIAALGTGNRAELRALELKFGADAERASQAAAFARREAREAIAEADRELAILDSLQREATPEPSLQEQNRYARAIEGRLTPDERREDLERQIASGEIPAERADEFRRGLEFQMADEARKKAARRSILTRTLASLSSTH